MSPENTPLLPWYTDTALQIRKDFGSAGAEVNFPEDCEKGPDQTLFECLLPVIRQLIKNDRRKLLQIIYRVDVPESRLGNAIADLNVEEAAAGITQLIIEREKLKIGLRRKY